MIFLITGASSGFGLAISTLLINNGHRVIGIARRKERLEVLQETLGNHFLPLCLDINDTQNMQVALKNLPNDFQNIDVLVNNAGLALGINPFAEAQFQDMLQMIDVNIKGLCSITHEILPRLLAKNSGLIINIGSIAGTYAYPGGHVYGASKAFVKQFSLNLRADLAGSKIRVTNIEPGLCGDTEFSLVRFKGDTEKVKSLYENVEFIKPEDIANTVLWIAEQPEHININSIEIMPTAQSFSPLKITRNV